MFVRQHKLTNDTVNIYNQYNVIKTMILSHIKMIVVISWAKRDTREIKKKKECDDKVCWKVMTKKIKL